MKLGGHDIDIDGKKKERARQHMEVLFHGR